MMLEPHPVGYHPAVQSKYEAWWMHVKGESFILYRLAGDPRLEWIQFPFGPHHAEAWGFWVGWDAAKREGVPSAYRKNLDIPSDV